MKRGVTQSVPCLFPSSRLIITSLKLTKPHLVSRCLSDKNDRTWVRLSTKSYLLFQSWGEGGNNGQYWFVRGTLAQAAHCHYCHYCHCEPLQSHCADACHGRLWWWQPSLWLDRDTDDQDGWQCVFDHHDDQDGWQSVFDHQDRDISYWWLICSAASSSVMKACSNYADKQGFRLMCCF